MITLTGYPVVLGDFITLKNPKVGNLETVYTGVSLKTTRRGKLYGSTSMVPIKKRRFDFQWLKLAEKEALLNFLILHIGKTVTLQWISNEICDPQIINELYIVDDQPLEIIAIHDSHEYDNDPADLNDHATYDCATYWIKI